MPLLLFALAEADLRGRAFVSTERGGYFGNPTLIARCTQILLPTFVLFVFFVVPHPPGTDLGTAEC